MRLFALGIQQFLQVTQDSARKGDVVRRLLEAKATVLHGKKTREEKVKRSVTRHDALLTSIFFSPAQVQRQRDNGDDETDKDEEVSVVCRLSSPVDRSFCFLSRFSRTACHQACSLCANALCYEALATRAQQTQAACASHRKSSDLLDGCCAQGSAITRALCHVILLYKQ